ncbi:MAG: hypothetical protein JNK65_02705 [Deltaproteobacteria bacterium]|nr:hypothetical protein [Deltaproteobacteria bacterium]
MLWRTPGYKIETIQSSILRLLNVSETHPERSQDWRSASVEIEQAGHLLDSEFREKALEIENRLLETGSHYSILDRLFSELDPNLTSKQRHFYRQNLNMTVAVIGTASWRHLSSERIFLESLYLARRFLSSGDTVSAEYILRQGISAVKSDAREANRLRDYMRQRQQSIFQFMNQVAVLDSTSLLWLQEQYEIKDPAEYPSVTVVIRNLRERLLYPSSRMTEEDSIRMLGTLRYLTERRVVEPLRDFIRAEGRLFRENASFLNQFAQQSVEVIASAQAFDSSNDSLRIAELGNLLLDAGHYRLAYEMMRRFYEIGYGDPMAYMNFLVSAVTQVEILQHKGVSELQEQELSRVQNRLMRWQQEFYY